MKILRKKKFYLIFFIICIFILLACFLFFNDQKKAPSDTSQTKEFTISQGESLDLISDRLKDEGFIKNPFVFKLVLARKGWVKKIQAGQFSLSADMTAEEIGQKLTLGFTDVWVTIPEGLRVEEVAETLSEKLNFSSEEFLEVAQEGKMFPDTYNLRGDSKPSDVAKILLSNYEKKFDQNLKNQASSQGLLEDEVLILASIVEREAKFASDRPIVAGILLNRYEISMALEVDATLQYALGYSAEEKNWWRKNLTAEDLDLDSPYNTRKYQNLPPTPICNPGIEAIKAVVNPSPTDYFYYLSDKNGKMHYATTLDEHVENIQKYL